MGGRGGKKARQTLESAGRDMNAADLGTGMHRALTIDGIRSRALHLTRPLLYGK